MEEIRLYEELKPYIDVPDALERVRGNKAILKSLLTLFLKDDYYLTLKGQLDAGDLAAAIHTAHAMKGLAANLSLASLYDAVLLLELQLKNGMRTDNDLPQLELTREKTRSCLERLASEL